MQPTRRKAAIGSLGLLGSLLLIVLSELGLVFVGIAIAVTVPFTLWAAWPDIVIVRNWWLSGNRNVKDLYRRLTDGTSEGVRLEPRFRGLIGSYVHWEGDINEIRVGLFNDGLVSAKRVRCYLEEAQSLWRDGRAGGIGIPRDASMRTNRLPHTDSDDETINPRDEALFHVATIETRDDGDPLIRLAWDEGGGMHLQSGITCRFLCRATALNAEPVEFVIRLYRDGNRYSTNLHIGPP